MQSQEASTRIFLGGVPKSVSERDIDLLLQDEKLPKPISIWVARNPAGFAFLTFEDESQASQAVTSLSGKKLHGKELSAEFSHKKQLKKPRERDGDRDRDREPPRYRERDRHDHPNSGRRNADYPSRRDEGQLPPHTFDRDTGRQHIRIETDRHGRDSRDSRNSYSHQNTSRDLDLDLDREPLPARNQDFIDRERDRDRDRLDRNELSRDTYRRRSPSPFRQYSPPRERLERLPYRGRTPSPGRLRSLSPQRERERDRDGHRGRDRISRERTISPRRVSSPSHDVSQRRLYRPRTPSPNSRRFERSRERDSRERQVPPSERRGYGRPYLHIEGELRRGSVSPLARRSRSPSPRPLRRHSRSRSVSPRPLPPHSRSRSISPDTRYLSSDSTNSRPRRDVRDSSRSPPRHLPVVAQYDDRDRDRDSREARASLPNHPIRVERHITTSIRPRLEADRELNLRDSRPPQNREQRNSDRGLERSSRSERSTHDFERERERGDRDRDNDRDRERNRRDHIALDRHAKRDRKYDSPGSPSSHQPKSPASTLADEALFDDSRRYDN